MTTDGNMREHWDGVAADLRAYRKQQRQGWGDIDDALVGRYLADEVTPQERQRIEDAARRYPDLGTLIELVRTTLDEFALAEQPVILAFPPVPAPAATPSVVPLGRPSRAKPRYRLVVTAAACLFVSVTASLIYFAGNLPSSTVEAPDVALGQNSGPGAGEVAAPGSIPQQAKLQPDHSGLKQLSLAKNNHVPPAPSPADFPESWPSALGALSAADFTARASGGGALPFAPVVAQQPLARGPDFGSYPNPRTSVTLTASSPYWAYPSGTTLRSSLSEAGPAYFLAVPRKQDATAHARRTLYRPRYATAKVEFKAGDEPRTSDGADVAKEVAAFVTRGKDALGKGKYEDAVTAFAWAARVRPDDAELQVVLERALQLRDRQEQQHGIRLAVDDGATRKGGVRLGVVTKAARDRARLAFHKAEGRRCLECGRCADAAVEFEAALHLSPDDAEATGGLKQATQGP